jgi:hypothetical protein
MIFLSRWILLSSLFLIGCTGLETFLIGVTGNVSSHYVINNVDLKEYEKVNVKIVKLTSGEELIGEFDEATNTISNPVVMIPVNNEKIAFSPWMPYSEDKKFQLKEEQILLVATPSKVITNEYNRAFGSGIVVP